MIRLLVLCLGAVLLGGCSSLEATSAWKGRPVGELIDYFGVPRVIMVAPDQDMVVLRYVRDSTYISREAAGTYTALKMANWCTASIGRMSSTQAVARSTFLSTGRTWCRKSGPMVAVRSLTWRPRRSPAVGGRHRANAR